MIIDERFLLANKAIMIFLLLFFAALQFVNIGFKLIRTISVIDEVEKFHSLLFLLFKINSAFVMIEGAYKCLVIKYCYNDIKIGLKLGLIL